ncbi:Clavaminate synthase-like protein [Lentinus tigrinus ALCF2SS1-7]|uniref:Clavaminate synthase-like protein n=1 Tax=Lentinus tigrinus ALCF2SS1-6 TaxID=1328759 RepID=A0A5C2SA58_9APHY|nr:Clavaminate synthase-like protein [Lentinus tigrinus ALCF2SS1-6]RPD75813.1 Clavaminate synthase-like protein [Lentinus tigrinus ALCF2SS1-7]
MKVSSLSHYVPAPSAKEELNWAELPVIDLSKAATPEARAELMPIVRDAMHTYGFMYIINHGLSPAQNQRIFDIADVPFSQVPEEKKKLYESKTRETGMFRGYKPRKYFQIDNGVQDSFEHYNIHHTVNDGRDHPASLLPFLPEIREFNEYNHFHILYPILQLLALGLELPESTFTDIHPFDDSAALTWTRFTKYYPYESEEDAKAASDVWFKGHTDITTVSILWSQPVAALQLKDLEGNWRWVKHMENALVVNIGESMEMLSGGFYKAAIHRVVQPPASQRGYVRLGVFYFVLAENNVKLVPLADSPVLKRMGVVRPSAEENAPTEKEWLNARVSVYGQPDSKSAKQENGDAVEEVVKGFFTTHYN